MRAQMLGAESTTALAANGASGEAWAFWILAIVSVLSAIGLVTARKAVHSAMFIAVVMLSLAGLYVVQEAPFLGVVQVVVYTGAIMMLFLFVIMLVGVGAADSRVETIRGQRVAAVVVGLAFGALLIAVIGGTLFPEPVGMADAAPEGNVAAVADTVFGRYVFVFEVITALFITAVLGAMVLAHRERIERRPTQRELSQARFRKSGAEMGPLPSSGVYARHNAVDTPALLPDGTPSELSISPVLKARGAVRPAETAADDVAQLEKQVDDLSSGGDEQ